MCSVKIAIYVTKIKKVSSLYTTDLSLHSVLMLKRFPQG
jgi:hypothetical protein